MSGSKNTYEGLKELMVRQQSTAACHKYLHFFLMEWKFEQLLKLLKQPTITEVPMVVILASCILIIILVNIATDRILEGHTKMTRTSAVSNVVSQGI